MSLLVGCSLFGEEEDSEESAFEVELEGFVWPDPNLDGLVHEPYAGLHSYRTRQRDNGGNRGRLRISLGVREQRSDWYEGVTFFGAFNGEGRYPITLSEDEYREHRRSGNVADVRGELSAAFTEFNVDYSISEYEPVFDPATGTAGELVITRYDSTEGIIEGHFEVTLALAYIEDDQPELHGYLHPLPDTLRFTEGRFLVTDINDQRGCYPEGC